MHGSAIRFPYMHYSQYAVSDDRINGAADDGETCESHRVGYASDLLNCYVANDADGDTGHRPRRESCRMLRSLYVRRKGAQSGISMMPARLIRFVSHD